MDCLVDKKFEVRSLIMIVNQTSTNKELFIFIHLCLIEQTKEYEHLNEWTFLSVFVCFKKNTKLVFVKILNIHKHENNQMKNHK